MHEVNLTEKYSHNNNNYNREETNPFFFCSVGHHYTPSGKLSNYCCFADPGLILMVQDPVINATEPNDGTNVTVSSCFQANVTRPRRRAAMFVLTFLNSSTAYEGLDFIVEHVSYIAIPGGFSGVFTECVNISITGDNIIEGDEVIEYSVMPMSDRDMLDISGPLRVNIFDNDGMYLRVIWHYFRHTGLQHCPMLGNKQNLLTVTCNFMLWI
jgi:hypothetical protein